MGPTAYKGKSINDENIQNCISSLVSKYMPSDYSPWQIKAIPYSDHSAYYLLIRIHHLILDEQKNLTIGDMMLLDRTKGMSILCKELNDVSKKLKKSPLTDIVMRPKNLITIYEDFCELFISRWNEFLYKHDSLEHFDKEGFSKPPEDLNTLLPSLTMTCVNVYYDYKQHSTKILKGVSDPQQHLRFIFHLFGKELTCRQINSRLILNLILRALHPINLFFNIGKFIIQNVAIWIFLTPVYALREFNAVRKLIFMHEEIDTTTYFGFLLRYIPIAFGSLKELFYFAQIIYTAPRIIIEDVFLQQDDSHYLNTSLCGRKNVSWSEKINVSDLCAIANENKRSYSEIMLATVSTCLMNFFKQLKKERKTARIPTAVKCNVRSVPFSYLYGYTRPIRNGVIGMNLPFPSTRESNREHYELIHEQIKEARRHQVIVYLLSLIQIRFDFLTTVVPSLWLKLAINFVSKKFSLCITEMYGIDEFEPNEYVTCYKGEIEDIIFFRTPQANNSAAIIIQRFKDQIRVNIMCDSNIENQHYVSEGVKLSFSNLITK